MSPTYWDQLRTLGVSSNQMPIVELKEKLASGDPAFTLDIEPETTPNDPYAVTFYYSMQGATGPVYLTHYVASPP